MGTEDKRTATDLLLDIDTKLDKLVKHTENSEFLLKTLLARLNMVLNGAQAPQAQPPQPAPHVPAVVNKDNFEERPKTSAFAQAAASHGLDVEDDDGPEPIDPFATEHLEEEFVARPQPPVVNTKEHDDMIEAPSRGNSRGQRCPKNKGAKISVSQSLVREDTPLFLANVELLDEAGTLLNQTRTNTKGRWMMALAPGSYQVHVLKRFPPDSGKKPIDVTYPITIPPSDKPMELDPLSLSGDG